MVFGALMRSRHNSNKDSKQSLVATVFEPHLLLHSPDMLLMGINCACWGGAVYTAFSLLNALVMDDVGLSKQQVIYAQLQLQFQLFIIAMALQSTMLASAVGLANVVGRVTASFIGHYTLVNRLVFYAFASFTMAIGLCLAASSTSMLPVLLALTLFGASFGIMLSQLAGVLIQLFGVAKLVNALGYSMFAVGIGTVGITAMAGMCNGYRLKAQS